MTTVAELLIESLADYGIKTVWGVVGDALNPVTDAIRREDRIEWIGVRHEEAGAFAASAQAQLSEGLAVCMGTVGPGAVHLLNGLYDAKKSHAPVLAICGQVPREEMGSEFFQEVDNDALFADVAVFNETVTTIDQLPELIEQAGNAAIQASGVAVLTLPGDVGGLDLPKGTDVPRFIDTRPRSMPAPDVVQQAASLLNHAKKVTLLVGQGAREGREEVLQLAERLSAPMVLTLKAKEGLERDNEYEIGQSGLLGNDATVKAFEGCDVLFMIGTDFPYRDFLPSDATVIQLDVRGSHIGRRTTVDVALVGDAALGLQALLPLLEKKEDRAHLEEARSAYDKWRKRQAEFTDPAYDAQAEGPAATQGREPRCPDPSRAARRDGQPARRVRRGVHHRHGDGHRLALAVRPDDRAAPTGGLVQPRFDGQCDAAGAGGQRPGQAAPGGRVLRRRRALHADGRHADSRHLRSPGQARRLRQRPARDGEARDGAGRAAGARHRAGQPRLRPGRRGHGDAGHPRRAGRRRGRSGPGGPCVRRPRAARRPHQPRRGRRPAVPDPGAGLGLRDREDEGVRRERRSERPG